MRPSNLGEELSETRVRRRSPLVYFLCVVLGLSLLFFASLNAAGLSPFNISQLFRRASANDTKVKERFPRPKKSPLFADTFVDNRSGWNVQSVLGTYSVVVANEELSLESDNHTLLWETLPGERIFTNFELFVDATLAKGDLINGYGIYIRGRSTAKSDLAEYYRFELYGDSAYALFKGSTDQHGMTVNTRVINYTLSPAIQKLGKTNHIVIIAQGSHFSLVVNNQSLVSFSDTSYASGSIALFVANLPGAPPVAEANFSQFSIYDLA